ncbi:MAG: hypothetical protein JNG88_06410 [Phycisphaerales bacterium]|nr:hypothetical protein [Phycisphaerales bacterium]
MRSVGRLLTLLISGTAAYYAYSFTRQNAAALTQVLGAVGNRPQPMFPAGDAAKYDAGRWDGRRYVNESLGFSMSVPQDWHIADQDTTDALTDRGISFVANGDALLMRMAQTAKATTIQLVLASEHAPGKPGKVNNNIVVTAESLRGYPGIESAADYARAVEGVLRKTPLNYEFGVLKTRVSIGGMKAACLPASLRAGNGQPEVQQRFYCVKMNDVALSFVLTYQDDIGFEKLRVVMNSIRFGAADSAQVEAVETVGAAD